MRIELITIGDELMLGFTIDTNAAHIGRELSAIGVEVVRRTTIGDAAGDIERAVREALDRTGAVVTTGGLGPTSDDRTREVIASMFGRRLVLDRARLDALRSRWAERKMYGPFPESNVAQAMIPEGADVLTNRHGTAPGLWLEDDRKRWVAMLPGVPREMRGMLAEELLPRLRGLTPDAAVIRSRTLRTTGTAESTLADLIGDTATALSPVTLAYLPGVDGVDLRLTVRGVPGAEADRILDDRLLKLRGRIERYVYAEGDSDLAAAVIALCRAEGRTIAVAESCTGGMLGARLTAVAGSSTVFVGGVIAYDNRVKREQLGVDPAELETHGAVSEPVVRAMARGARERIGASIGVGITGIAGPDGGSIEKPVGTVWIGLDGDPAEARCFRFVGDRTEIRQRAAQAALSMIRQSLVGN